MELGARLPVGIVACREKHVYVCCFHCPFQRGGELDICLSPMSGVLRNLDRRVAASGQNVLVGLLNFYYLACYYGISTLELFRQVEIGLSLGGSHCYCMLVGIEVGNATHN